MNYTIWWQNTLLGVVMLSRSNSFPFRELAIIMQASNVKIIWVQKCGDCQVLRPTLSRFSSVLKYIRPCVDLSCIKWYMVGRATSQCNLVHNREEISFNMNYGVICSLTKDELWGWFILIKWSFLFQRRSYFYNKRYLFKRIYRYLSWNFSRRSI